MSAKSIYNNVLLGISFCLMTGAVVAAGTNPITLTYAGGTPIFAVGDQGSANYAACRDPRVPAGTLPLYFNDLGGGNYASQITTGSSLCTGISTVCAAPFSLASGSCCCLELGLNTNGNLSAGTYSLIAEVGTEPDSTSPVYGGKAQPLAVQVSSAPSGPVLTVVSPTTQPLALSVNCPLSSTCTTTKNAALTGAARTITIQNIGGSLADITTVTSSGLPSGTNITSDTCANTTLAAGLTCTITITPGENASTGAGSASCTTGIAPIAGSVSVNASNATTVSAGVEVLSYGCVYQGGFIYSVDDTSNIGSIGGKVASLTDQADPYTTGPQLTSIIWGSNGTGSTCPTFPTTCDVSYDIIPGIDQTSTTGTGSPAYTSGVTTTYTFTNMYNASATYYTYSSANPFPPNPFQACNGAANGSCNQQNILDYYNAVVTHYNVNAASPYVQTAGPTNLAYYAAGLCYNDTDGGAINGDWYLPAICEMDAVYGAVTTCPAGTQSMVNTLSFLIGNPAAGTPSTSCTPPASTDCLAGSYWSSTEDSGGPQVVAWDEYFSSGGSFQNFTNKSVTLGVRCSRALTI